MSSSIAGSPPGRAPSPARLTLAIACSWVLGAGNACNVYTSDLLVSGGGGKSTGGRTAGGGGSEEGGFGGTGGIETGGSSAAGAEPTDGGMTTAGGTSDAGNAGSAGWTRAGTSPIAGSNSGGANAGTGAGASGSGGGGASGGAAVTACTRATPAQLCALKVDAKAYVNTTAVKGTVFAWKGDDSTSGTRADTPCISNCGSSSGMSALCVAGGVTIDPSFHSAAGLGVYLNEDQSSGTKGAITIPNSITISIDADASSGNGYLRPQLTDVAGVDYCVEKGEWLPGTPIPIGKFNTQCWNGGGAFASPSTQMTELDFIVPSTNVGDRAFNFCVGSITIQ